MSRAEKKDPNDVFFINDVFISMPKFPSSATLFMTVAVDGETSKPSEFVSVISKLLTALTPVMTKSTTLIPLEFPDNTIP